MSQQFVRNTHASGSNLLTTWNQWFMLFSPFRKVFPMQWLKWIFLVCHGRDCHWIDWIVAEGAVTLSWYVLLDTPERCLQQSSVPFFHGHVVWRPLFLHSTTVLAYSFNLLLTYMLNLHTWLNVSKALTIPCAGWNSSPFWDMFLYPVDAIVFWFLVSL